MGTFIIGSIVALAFIGAMVNIIKTKKKGGCSGCSGSCGKDTVCHKK